MLHMALYQFANSISTAKGFETLQTQALTFIFVGDLCHTQLTRQPLQSDQRCRLVTRALAQITINLGGSSAAQQSSLDVIKSVTSRGH